jgi:hypothetical protein
MLATWESKWLLGLKSKDTDSWWQSMKEELTTEILKHMKIKIPTIFMENFQGSVEFKNNRSKSRLFKEDSEETAHHNFQKMLTSTSTLDQSNKITQTRIKLTKALILLTHKSQLKVWTNSLPFKTLLQGQVFKQTKPKLKDLKFK